MAENFPKLMKATDHEMLQTKENSELQELKKSNRNDK